MKLKIFLKKVKKYIRNLCIDTPYSIISLGPNCYPKTVLTRTGLLKRRSAGQLTLPFDLAWYHSAKYITEFLDNDFENFLSDLRYSEYSGSWDNGEKINFSHEAYIGPTEKHRLIQVYRYRINNFRKTLSENNVFIFLQILKDTHVDEDCANTYNVLKKICGTKKFIYAVVDCINKINPENLPTEIYLMKKELPDKDADVFDKAFYTSEKGMQFEREIAKFIENIIINELAMFPINFL